jgi:hypothetical protein
MRQHRRAIGVTIDKGEFKMNVTEKLFLASILALSMVGPVQAQSPTQGDYYAPGPTTVVHPTEGQLKLNEQGDYYVGGKMILSKRRAAALKLRYSRRGVRASRKRSFHCFTSLHRPRGSAG